MSNSQNRPPTGGTNLPVNEKLLAQMLEAQLLKAKNDSRELDIRSKEVDHQAQYANNALKLQAELLRSKPTENRKSMRMLALIIMGFIALFIILVAICLYLNKDVFLLTLLKGIGYAITTLGGYWVGKKSNEKKDSVIEDNNSEP